MEMSYKEIMASTNENTKAAGKQWSQRETKCHVRTKKNEEIIILQYVGHFTV
jgi:hypothetical protein